MPMTTAAHVQIAPSVLAADFGRLAQQVRDADAAGADLIHVDIMDGRFVPQHLLRRGGGGRHPQRDRPAGSTCT